jgi:hypothetical protein
VPYQQIRSANLHEGVFHLYSTAESKPVISKPVSTPNFFPGFFVVGTLRQLAGNGGQGTAASGAEAETRGEE